MTACPDCDGMRITVGYDEGDGVCSECHGTGKDNFPNVVENYNGLEKLDRDIRWIC
jgi:mono/diheme cytochrome c family protein